MFRYQARHRRTTISAGAGLAALLLAGLTAAVVVAAGSPTRACEKSVSRRVPQPSAGQLAAAGLSKLPLAPDKQRVDLVAPAFSNPTNVTNPLFPISRLRSAILNGQIDGKAFRVETTLLPETAIVEWTDGQCVETLVSQYVAYLDGRIEEVALDRYAQPDVIMPGRPRLGDVYRPENIAGLVFEEVTVKTVGKTLDGPRGRIGGAIVASELHDDGTREDKAFAPGYGEFFTGQGRDVEALALAVPTDALAGPPPAKLRALVAGANAIDAAAASGSWKSAAAALEKMTSAWRSYQGVPRLEPPMSRALKALARSVEGRDRLATRQAALDVLQAGLDLELQYRPIVQIDLARFDLWLRRLIADAQGRDAAAVTGDVTTLEWIRDRVAYKLDKVDVTRIDTGLRELRAKAGDEDLKAAATTAAALRKTLAGLP
jgi:hypothetical protein